MFEKKENEVKLRTSLGRMDFELKQIGVIGVDSGLVWIGDPCYLLDDERPKSVGKDWSEFCDIINTNKDEETSSIPFNYDMGHKGLGVCSSTKWGDGTYPVYGIFEKGEDRGRPNGILIDFEIENMYEFLHKYWNNKEMLNQKSKIGGYEDDETNS
jgi:hypothetical protein